MTRELLPQRRPSEPFTFEHAGFDYRGTIGFYPDGRIGEVFLSAAKSGTRHSTSPPATRRSF